MFIWVELDRSISPSSSRAADTDRKDACLNFRLYASGLFTPAQLY